jgi:hypothetical protein
MSSPEIAQPAGRGKLDDDLLARIEKLEAINEIRNLMADYTHYARRRHFPVEKPYVYQPDAHSAELFHWNDAARVDIDAYYRRDLNI